MQQEVQRLQASLAKMEEERRKAEEKAQALSEALNQKEADALELKLCLTMEEAERNTVLKDMADLKQQLTFKDQDLRNAELLRARYDQTRSRHLHGKP
jgi:chromosome segregation ATPase